MQFPAKFSKILSKTLSERELSLLPKEFSLVGRIVSVNLDGNLESRKKEIGMAMLKMVKDAKSVVSRGEVIAGSRKTEIILKDMDCKLTFDPAKLEMPDIDKSEKMRLIQNSKPGETVVDMFAGVGHITIPLAAHTKPKMIHAIDVNPLAVEYLRRNADLNKLNNIIAHQGEGTEFAHKLENKADRVIMSTINSDAHLPAALKIAKEGGMIHFHDLCSEDDIPARLETLRGIAARSGQLFDVTDIQELGSRTPGVFHFVYDLKKA